MKKILHLLPLILVIFACGAQPQPTSNVADMVSATLTAMAPDNQQTMPQAAATAAPNVAISGMDMSYSGTSFTIPTGLASGAQNENIPQANNPNVPLQVYPAYTRFTLQGYPLQGKAFEPQVLIYPTKDFAQMSDNAKTTIDSLQNILTAQSASPTEFIPFLPMVNARQMFHTQEKFLSFKNGTGIRYITQFEQMPAAPINNAEILYTFQGLTSDGSAYVSVTMPVNLPFLPVDNSAPSITPPDGVPFEMDMAKYPDYLLAISNRLNQAGNFNPSLESLDALVQSINATNTSSALPANPNPVSAPVTSTTWKTWKTYRNDTYGFTFEYPVIYDEAPYSDTCGLRPSDAGIHFGHQIDLFFLNANGQSLTQFTDNMIQTNGWTVDSQTNDPINGLEATAVQYRFGGTNRFGTFTLVKQGEQIFDFNFSAGGFCETPADQPAEPAAYDHMIETFQLNK